jgi:hypothetical protein
MASRHLRRLQEQLAAKQQEGPASEDESSDGGDDGGAGSAVAAKPFNPFDLLDDDDGVSMQLAAGNHFTDA